MSKPPEMTPELRRKISDACRQSERFQQTHRQPRSLEARAALSASMRVKKKDDEATWTKLYELALKRLVLQDGNAGSVTEIKRMEQSVMEKGAKNGSKGNKTTG